MNVLQRLVLVGGVGLLLAVMFAPPWNQVEWGFGPYRETSLGHVPVWEMPVFGSPIEETRGEITRVKRVNVFRWTIEALAIIGLTAGLLWALRTNPHEHKT